jgi:hypothetical protein
MVLNGVSPAYEFNANNTDAISAFFLAVKRSVCGDNNLIKRIVKYELTGIDHTTVLGVHSSPTPIPISNPTPYPSSLQPTYSIGRRLFGYDPSAFRGFELVKRYTIFMNMPAFYFYNFINYLTAGGERAL